MLLGGGDTERRPRRPVDRPHRGRRRAAGVRDGGRTTDGRRRAGIPGRVRRRRHPARARAATGRGRVHPRRRRGRRPAPAREGVRPRRVRQPVARQGLADAVVSRRRAVARAAAQGGRRARGVHHAARRQRAGADGAGRDGRPHGIGRLDHSSSRPAGARWRRPATSTTPSWRCLADAVAPARRSTSPTCGSIRTPSSSPTTACCSPTSARPPWRRRPTSSPPTGPSCSPRPPRSRASTGRSQAADRAIGREALGALLPYLQTAAFPSGPPRRAEGRRRSTSTSCASAPPSCRASSSRCSRACAASRSAPSCSWRCWCWPAAAIIAAAGNVDFDELQKDLEDAAWGWAAGRPADRCRRRGCCRPRPPAPPSPPGWHSGRSTRCSSRSGS